MVEDTQAIRPPPGSYALDDVLQVGVRVRDLEGRTGFVVACVDENEQELSGDHTGGRVFAQTPLEFEIECDNETYRLGIDVQKPPTVPLQVEAITQGLVPEWNRKNPDKAVKVGDAIVRVNKLRQEDMVVEGQVSMALRKEIQNSPTVTLRIRRDSEMQLRLVEACRWRVEMDDGAVALYETDQLQRRWIPRPAAAARLQVACARDEWADSGRRRRKLRIAVAEAGFADGDVDSDLEHATVTDDAGYAFSVDDEDRIASVAVFPVVMSFACDPQREHQSRGGGLAALGGRGGDAAPAGTAYSEEEVAKHTTKGDCWTIWHGQVLDLTKYLASHPGGELSILTFAGKDCSDEFDMIHPPDTIERYAPETIIGVVGEAGAEGGATGGAPEEERRPSENVAKRSRTFARPAEWTEAALQAFLAEVESHGEIVESELQDSKGVKTAVPTGSKIWEEHSRESLSFPVTLTSSVRLAPSTFHFEVKSASDWSRDGRDGLLAKMQSTGALGPEDFVQAAATDAKGAACGELHPHRPWSSALPKDLVYPLTLTMQVVIDPLCPRTQRDIEIQLELSEQWERRQLREIHRRMRVRAAFDIVRLTAVDSKGARTAVPCHDELRAGVPWDTSLDEMAFPVRLQYTVLGDPAEVPMEFKFGIKKDGWCSEVLDATVKQTGVEEKDLIMFRVEDAIGKRWDVLASKEPLCDKSPRSFELRWPVTLTVLGFVPKERAQSQRQQSSIFALRAMMSSSNQQSEERKRSVFAAWRRLAASDAPNRIELVGFFKFVDSDAVEVKESADIGKAFAREFVPAMKAAGTDVGYFAVRNVNEVVCDFGASLPAFVGDRVPERHGIRIPAVAPVGFVGEIQDVGAANEVAVFKVELGWEVVSFRANDELVRFYTNKRGLPGMYFVKGKSAKRYHFPSLSFDSESGSLSFRGSDIVLQIPEADTLKVLPLLQNAAVLNGVETLNFESIWAVQEGLPLLEGLALDMDTSCAKTVKHIRAKCSSHPECVGFAYSTADGQWFPRKTGTGFSPSTEKYSQKVDGQTWQWHYLPDRATDVIVEFCDEQPTGMAQPARFFYDAGGEAMQVRWGQPEQRCSFVKAIFDEDTRDLTMFYAYSPSLDGVCLRVPLADVRRVIAELKNAAASVGVELSVKEASDSVRPSLSAAERTALIGKWNFRFAKCEVPLTVEADGSVTDGTTRAPLLAVRDVEAADGWLAFIQHRFTRRGYQAEHDGHQLLKLDNEKLVLMEWPGALAAEGIRATPGEGATAAQAAAGCDLETPLLDKPKEGPGDDPGSKEGRELSEGCLVKLENDETAFKEAFAGTGYDWDPEMGTLVGNKAIVLEQQEFGMVRCVLEEDFDRGTHRKWLLPESVVVDVVVHARRLGALGSDLNLQAIVVFALVGLLAFAGVVAVDCSLGPFASQLSTYQPDMLADAVHMASMTPFEFMPIENSLRVVLLFMVLGMDLKFAPPKPSSPLKARGMYAAKQGMTMGLTAVVLKAYAVDASRLLAADYEYAIDYVALLPVVLICSPNFPNAVAIWSKLAIQSPVPVMKVTPKYEVFGWSAFVKGIGFPKRLGAATWISPFQQIYAYSLLPYMAVKVVLLKLLNILTFFMLILDVLLCNFRWLFVASVTLFYLCLWVVMIVAIYATCFSDYSVDAFHYFSSALWPLIYMVVLQTWASAVPLIFARLYGYVLNLTWLECMKSIFWNSNWSPATMTSSVVMLFSPGGLSSLWQDAKGGLFKTLTENIWSGMPPPIKISKKEKELLKQYNQVLLADDFENSEVDRRLLYSLDGDGDDPMASLEKVGSQLQKNMDASNPMAAMQNVQDMFNGLADGGVDDVVSGGMNMLAGGGNDDARALRCIKLAIVTATLRTVVFVLLQQFTTIFFCRLLRVAFVGASLSSVRASLDQTLFERSMAGWGAPLRRLQVQLRDKLFLLPFGPELLAPFDGVCGEARGAPQQLRTFANSEATEAVINWGFAVATAATLGFALYKLRGKIRDSLKAKPLERVVMVVGLVLLVFMCAVSRGSYDAAQTCGMVGYAMIMQVLRVAFVLHFLYNWEQFGVQLNFLPLWYIQRFHPELNNTLNFFWGLGKEHDQESADALVDEVIKWGGVYPKLAQRLRTDKAIVKSEALRKAFSQVMEHCKSRTQEQVVAHLCKEMLLKKEDVEFKKTLGTGSVAQVVLVGIRRGGEVREGVFKMTWPEDEQRFIADFAVFESLRDKANFMSKFADVEELSVFLKTVLSKKDDILQEFDLIHELKSTRHGKGLVDKWVPPVFENNDVSLLTLEFMKSEVVKSGTPLEKIQGMSKADLRKEILRQRGEQACFTFTDADGAVVTVKQRGKDAKCYLQGLGRMDTFQNFDAATGSYRTSGGRMGTVPKSQLAAVEDYLLGRSKLETGDLVVTSSRRGWILQEYGGADNETFQVALEGGGMVRDVKESDLQHASFTFRNEQGDAVAIRGRGPNARASVEAAGRAGELVFDPETRRYRAGGAGAAVPEDQAEALQAYLSRGLVDRFLPRTVRGAAVLEEVQGRFRVAGSRLFYHKSCQLQDIDPFVRQARPGDVVTGVVEGDWVKVQIRSPIAAGDVVIAGTEGSRDLGTVIEGPDQKGQYSIAVEASASPDRINKVVQAGDLSRVPFTFHDADGAVVTVTSPSPVARCSVERAGAAGAFESFDSATRSYRTGSGTGNVPKAEAAALQAYLASRSSAETLQALTVDLDVEGVDYLGLSVVQQGTQYSVTDVFAGPVFEWNLENPHMKVSKADIITHVNDAQIDFSCRLLDQAVNGRLRLRLSPSKCNERPTTGDKVRIVHDTRGEGKEGRITEIIRDDHDSSPYVLKDIDGYFSERDVEMLKSQITWLEPCPIELPSQCGFVDMLDLTYSLEVDGPPRRPPVRVQVKAEQITVPPIQFTDGEGRTVELSWRGSQLTCSMDPQPDGFSPAGFRLHGLVYRVGSCQGTVPSEVLPSLKVFLAHRAGGEIRYPTGLRVTPSWMEILGHGVPVNATKSGSADRPLDWPAGADEQLADLRTRFTDTDERQIITSLVRCQYDAEEATKLILGARVAALEARVEALLKANTSIEAGLAVDASSGSPEATTDVVLEDRVAALEKCLDALIEANTSIESGREVSSEAGSKPEAAERGDDGTSKVDAGPADRVAALEKRLEALTESSSDIASCVEDPKTKTAVRKAANTVEGGVIVDGPCFRDDRQVTLLGLRNWNVPLAKLRKASLSFVDVEGSEVTLTEPAGEGAVTCFVQTSDEKHVSFVGYDKETMTYKTSVKEGKVMEAEAKELEAHLEARDSELRVGDSVEVLQKAAYVTKSESGCLELCLAAGVTPSGTFQPEELLRDSFQFSDAAGATLTVRGLGEGARCSVEEPGAAGLFGGFDPGSRLYRAGGRSGVVPEDQSEGLRLHLANQGMPQRNDKVKVAGRRGRCTGSQPPMCLVSFDDGRTEIFKERSNYMLDEFIFTDEDGAKVTVTGLGPLARCSVELPGEAGAFRGFDPEARRYELGGGRAGTVPEEEVARKLQEYLSGNHSHFEKGERVILKGGAAQILELKDGCVRFCYNDHRGVSRGLLQALCFVRSSFTFTDADGEVVTLFGRTAGARCAVASEAEAFEGLDLSKGQYCVAGRKGKVMQHQLQRFREYLEGGASDLLKGDRVVLRERLAVITDIREARGLVKVMFKDETESEFVPAAEVTRRGLSVQVKSPAAYTHGRHILEQDFVKGNSLEGLMNLAAKAEDLQNRMDFGALAKFSDAGFENPDDFHSALAHAFDAYTFGFVPVLGSMLMHDGFGHADPHAGNLIFDHRAKTLWVIDWGAMVELSVEQRTGLRDLCHEVCMAEIEQPSSEEDIEAAERSFARAPKYIGADFWRYVFHPQKYDAPKGLDLEALKKSLTRSEVVLCLETMILTSRLLKEANVRMAEQQKKLPTPPVALLSLWDGVVALRQPIASFGEDDDGVADDIRTATVVRRHSELAEAGGAQAAGARRRASSGERPRPVEASEKWRRFRGSRLPPARARTQEEVRIAVG